MTRNIVTGVSFLGAGTIYLKSDRVTGLTTAAGIWVMAAIGMCMGTGMYLIGLVATIMIIIVQSMFQHRSFGILRVKVPGRIEICMDDTEESLVELLAFFEKHGVDIDSTHIKRKKGNEMLYSFRLMMPEQLELTEIVTMASAIESIKMVDI